MKKYEEFEKIIDWQSLLLDSYKNLSLTDQELLVILMMEHYIKKGMELITPDILALKMTLDFKEIDQIVANLIKKGFVSLVANEEGKLITSIDELKNIVLSQFILKAYRKSETKNEDQYKAENLIYENLEDCFGRKITSFEIEIVREWIEQGFSEKRILYAISLAIEKKVRNIRYIDKLLLQLAQEEERDQEGYTTLSDVWRKNIEETSELIKLDWDEEDE